MGIHRIEILACAVLTLPMYLVMAIFTLLLTLVGMAGRPQFRTSPAAHNRIARRLFREASFRYALRTESSRPARTLK